jgi:PadR family transcriptional regulator PadR
MGRTAAGSRSGSCNRGIAVVDSVRQPSVDGLAVHAGVGVYVEAGGIVPAPKSDLPQGMLDMLILQVVSLEPIHGYAIAQRLRQLSRDVVRVPQGSLYPALHRLENRKLLEAVWKQSETGREAKYYRLTARGRAQLKTEGESWERLSVAIRLILRSARGDAS